MKKITLNGDWTVSGQSADEKPLQFIGKVPGCIHTDLMRLGCIKDPLVSGNSKACLWIEDIAWTYEKTFSAEPCTDQCFLEFAMLDVYCDVYLNGEKLGFCDDMFIPHTFDITGKLRSGDNHIRVDFYPPRAFVAERPPRNAAFTNERVHTRRIQCTYSWDWVDRFVTMGICGDAALLFPDECEIGDVYVRTLGIDKYSAKLSVSTDFSRLDTDAFLRMNIFSPSGEKVFSRRLRIVESNLTQTADIENPQLWYPSGYGGSPLYKICVTAESADGTVLSQKEIKYGLRKVKILELPDKEDSEYYLKCQKLKETAAFLAPDTGNDQNSEYFGFIVTVNEIPIMCKGANWVPSEPFVSAETPEKITKILTLAKNGGMNMVRVWGGGIFENEHFYSECDRLGIMICQDFLMACGDYPDDEEFCANVRKEAEYITRRLRNHPCLIWWSGDNENAMDAHDDMKAYQGRKIVREVIEPVVRKNDPDGCFFPSSPYGGKPYKSVTCGTTHNTAFAGEKLNEIIKTDMKNYRDFTSVFLSRFSAEEPVLGAPMMSAVKKFMTEDEINDPDEKMWRFHTKDNPGAFDGFELYDCIREGARKLYGEFTNVDDKLCKMQYFQYEWVTITMELYRRNKWFSSGMLYWMLNDCWPAFGWSLIDYYAMPKAAWYGFKRSAKGVIASFEKGEKGLKVFVCNDTLAGVKGELTVYEVSQNGYRQICRQPFDMAANTSGEVFETEADISADKIFVCDLHSDGGRDRALWFKELFADTLTGRGKVEIISQTHDSITLQASGYVHAVMLDGGDVIFDDNCFAMLDGEVKTVNFAPGSNGQLSVCVSAF